jgi:hypothetical protein
MRPSKIAIALLNATLACALVASPSRASAQTSGSAPRIAGIAPAPAPTTPPGRADGHRGPVFFGRVPVVILNDGRVFADFGRGFEQVVRPCGVPVNFGAESAPVVQQPGVVQPAVTQPAIGSSQVQPYTPPVPNQMTGSQQMLQAQQLQASKSTVVNSQMCWSNDAHGRVFVGRP